MTDISSAPEWAQRLIAAHLSVTDQVSHSERLSSDRYFVWQEDGSDDLFSGDGGAVERAVTGSTDLFTKQEFDSWKDEFEAALTNADILWYLNSIQYEPETGFYHYEWIWTVA